MVELNENPDLIKNNCIFITMQKNTSHQAHLDSCKSHRLSSISPHPSDNILKPASHLTTTPGLIQPFRQTKATNSLVWILIHVDSHQQVREEANQQRIVAWGLPNIRHIDAASGLYCLGIDSTPQSQHLRENVRDSSDSSETRQST